MIIWFKTYVRFVCKLDNITRLAYISQIDRSRMVTTEVFALRVSGLGQARYKIVIFRNGFFGRFFVVYKECT